MSIETQPQLTAVEVARAEDYAELLLIKHPGIQTLGEAYAIAENRALQYAGVVPVAELQPIHVDPNALAAARELAMQEARLDDLADKLGNYTLARAQLGLPAED